MAVSNQEMLSMLQQQQTPAEEQPTPPPNEQASQTAPMPSPMSTPEPKSGEMEQARLSVMMALDMLQDALKVFGSESKEGDTLAKIVGDLTTQFGERESETRQLMPAEVMQLISTLPQAGGASPAAKVLAQAPVPGTQQPVMPV
jgi:hypothetical protein